METITWLRVMACFDGVVWFDFQTMQTPSSLKNQHGFLIWNEICVDLVSDLE
jgi:hypothetical protein